MWKKAGFSVDFAFKFDNRYFLYVLTKMIISLLMTLASFMGLFMIHYHNTTVYQPQLLLTAPIVVQKPEVYVIPDNEFYLEPILFDDEVVDTEEINIDDSSFDDEAPMLVTPVLETNTSSPLLASMPFVLISTYIVLLLCVQRQVLLANKDAVEPKKRRNVSNQEYLGIRHQ
jgi:hypothetical protein